MKNKIIVALPFVLILCLSISHPCDTANEFQRWTACGEAYNEWTKSGSEYNKWTAGPNGYQPSEYSEAYQLGRIEAYRSEHGMSSVTPIPTITPIENVGYTKPIDGFRRGFYEYYQERKKEWENGK